MKQAMLPKENEVCCGRSPPTRAGFSRPAAQVQIIFQT